MKLNLVSGPLRVPPSRVKQSKKKFFTCLTLEGGMHRLYRKVYNYQTTRRYIPEEQNLNHSAAEA